MLLGTDGVGFAADSSIDKLTAKNWQPVPCGRQSLLCKSDRKAPQVSSAAGNQSALKWEEMPSRGIRKPMFLREAGKSPFSVTTVKLLTQGEMPESSLLASIFCRGRWPVALEAAHLSTACREDLPGTGARAGGGPSRGRRGAGMAFCPNGPDRSRRSAPVRWPLPSALTEGSLPRLPGLAR